MKGPSDSFYELDDILEAALTANNTTLEELARVGMA